jgi:hypothetical protein
MVLSVDASGFPGYWAGLVNERNGEAVLDLYDQEAILMPTFSPHTAVGREALKAYFEQLLSRDSLSVTLHEDTVGTFHPAERSDLVFGVYSFAFDVDGTVLTFPARFTFALDLTRSTPILHHHSSQIPRTLS